MENTLDKQVALFGGTFDPIHVGHINLAVQMLEEHSLDLILFSPAFCSPYKEKAPPDASISDRINMVKLAIEKHPSFEILDFESKKPSLSYTIDTLRYLKTKYPDSSLFLILSEDSAKDFFNWRQVKEILSIAKVLIGGKVFSFPDMKASFQDVLKKGFTRISTFEVSSTQIRQRLKKRLYCSHLLYLKVLKYIEERRLYRS